MKRRILAVLLALAVVLALALPALAAVSADTVPYNTGTRHELCTAEDSAEFSVLDTFCSLSISLLNFQGKRF